MSDNEIGKELGVSRHTVSRLRRGLEESNYIKKINLPDLKILGFEILTFFHIRFDPNNPPDIEKNEAALLMSDSTVFMANRIFESVMISIYSNYDEYNSDKIRIMQILKENKWITENPMIRTYSLNELIFIKEFKFGPIAQKILGCDFLI
jgi:DNA-binding Lrp family transcriptional regulator